MSFWSLRWTVAFVAGGRHLRPSSRNENARMRKAELGDFTAARPASARALAPKSPCGLELLPGRAARPDEVRVIGVCEPVRTRLRGADDTSLREGQHGARGARRRQHFRDRLGAFRIGERMARALLDAELDLLGGRDLGDELRAAPLPRAELEMGPRDTPAAQKRAARDTRPGSTTGRRRASAAGRAAPTARSARRPRGVPGAPGSRPRRGAGTASRPRRPDAGSS